MKDLYTEADETLQRRETLSNEGRDISDPHNDGKSFNAAIQWESTMDAIKAMVAIINKDRIIIRANQAMKDEFEGDVIGKKCHEVFHGSSSPFSKCGFCEVFSSGKPFSSEVQEKHMNNRWLDIYIHPIIGESGSVEQVVHVVRDISEHKSLIEKLEAANNELWKKEKKTSGKMQGIIETMGDGLMIEDENGLVTFANNALLEMMDYENAGEVLQKHWSDFFSLEQEKVVTSSKGSYESVLLTKNGDKIPILVSSRSFYFEEEYVGVLSVIKDITDQKQTEQALIQYRENLEELVMERTSELMKTTEKLKREIDERKQAEEKIKYLALHDSLTDLPNRYLFFDRLQHAIDQADRHNSLVAVLYLDLDGFKSVNDTYSHEAGDAVLKITAARLRESLRKSDTVARLGGDEFSVILLDLKDEIFASEVARKIIKYVVEPIEYDGNVLTISASIGISIYPKNGKEAFELLRNADEAMYKVKKSMKNNFAYYIPE